MKIKTYEVWVSLGCSQAEQSFFQPVHFNIEIEFNHTVKGCQTDQLIDAVDYVEIVNLIKKTAEAKSYHLIEHLCQACHLVLEESLIKNNYDGELKTSVLKLRAPVKYLQGGVEFTCHSKF